MGNFDPKNYPLESHLKDMLKGYDVSSGDTYVIKQKGNDGKAFISSDSEKGHDRYDKKDGKWVKTH